MLYILEYFTSHEIAVKLDEYVIASFLQIFLQQNIPKLIEAMPQAFDVIRTVRVGFIARNDAPQSVLHYHVTNSVTVLNDWPETAGLYRRGRQRTRRYDIVVHSSVRRIVENAKFAESVLLAD